MGEITQIEVISVVARSLEAMGIECTTTRIFNKVIELANECLIPFCDAAPDMGLRAWLACDDTGLSSKYMAHVCANGPYAKNNYPHDPSDFGRCYRFLRAVPAARINLHKLTASGPAWAALVEHWDDLERTYEEELPTGKAPRLYKMMCELCEDK